MKRKSSKSSGIGAKRERPGRPLERLVSAIERATQNDKQVRVESPKFLRDKDTGRDREHDVVLTFAGQHHTLILALECRDRSRPVGVHDVEAFHTKCLRTGVNRGVIVSPSGFDMAAIKKAASFGIGCLTLTQAEGFPWCEARGTTQVERRLKTTHIHATVSSSHAAAGFTRVDPVRLFANDGTFVDDAMHTNIGRQCLDRVTDTEPGVGLTFRCKDPNPAFHVLDGNGARFELSSLRIDITYDVAVSFIPFSFRSYSDVELSEPLYTVASARIAGGKIAGELVGGEGAVLTFQPDPNASSPATVRMERKSEKTS